MIKTIGVVVGLVLASMFFAGCKPKSEGELTKEEIDAATAAMEKASTKMGEMIDDGNAIEEDSVAEGAGEEVSATPGPEKQGT